MQLHWALCTFCTCYVCIAMQLLTCNVTAQCTALVKTFFLALCTLCTLCTPFATPLGVAQTAHFVHICVHFIYCELAMQLHNALGRWTPFLHCALFVHFVHLFLCTTLTCKATPPALCTLNTVNVHCTLWVCRAQTLECLIFTLFWASKKAGLFFCWQ